MYSNYESLVKMKEKEYIAKQIHKDLLEKIKNDFKNDDMSTLEKLRACKFSLFETFCHKLYNKEEITEEDFKLGDIFKHYSSLRVTHLGRHLLKEYYDYEEFWLDRRLNSGELIILETEYTSPYYLEGKRLTLFNSNDIIIYKLTDNTTTWIKSLRN